MLTLAIFSPLQARALSGTYAALGDSVAAGSGLAGSSAPCHQSTEAYGYTVGASTGLPLHHLACIGAKVDEGLYDTQTREGYILPAQIDQAFSGGTPSLITVTVGANDARWTQFIRQCYYIRCGYDIDTARYAAYLADLKLELNIAMARIHTLSAGAPPRVIVTGYYQPFSGAACTDTAGLTSDEMTWLNSRTDALNSAINGTISKYSFTNYAPVSFIGHELCSSDPWIHGPNEGLPFHPTATGQQTIAAAVLSQYASPTPPSENLSLRERALEWFSRYQYY
jgi:lysophospholipase L1-like esterase